jgi:hypothetical protein
MGGIWEEIGQGDEQQTDDERQAIDPEKVKEVQEKIDEQFEVIKRVDRGNRRHRRCNDNIRFN